MSATIIFWKPKDNSLKGNSLPLFQQHECLKFGMATTHLSTMVSKTRFFVKKLKILNISDDTICFKFRQHVVQVRIKIMYGEALDFYSVSICNGSTVKFQ